MKMHQIWPKNTQKEPDLVQFQEKKIGKIAISIKLFGIFKRGLDCEELKPQRNF